MRCKVEKCENIIFHIQTITFLLTYNCLPSFNAWNLCVGSVFAINEDAATPD